MGRWEVGVWDAKATRPWASLVVWGVPLHWSTEAFKTKFLSCNGDRFPGVTAMQLSEGLGAPHHLKRRSPSGWTESTAMKLDLPPAVAEAVLAVGYAIVDLESRPIRPFQALPTVCAHCQRPGHKAAYCRNAPRCRICPETTGDHDTRECPRARRDGGGAASPAGMHKRSGHNGRMHSTPQNVGAQGAHSHNE